MTATAYILNDEQNLFLKSALGDQSAFRRIFDHYSLLIYPFILGKTKSHDIAQDLTQEIFVKLWSNREQMSSVENHSSYIFTMAARKVYMYFRKVARDEHLAKEFLERIDKLRNTTEEWMDSKEHEQLINKAIQQLPPQHRKIYELSRIQGMNHAEIAKELKLSTSTVNNQLTEALRSIRSYIQQSPETSLAIFLYLLQNGLK